MVGKISTVNIIDIDIEYAVTGMYPVTVKKSVNIDTIEQTLDSNFSMNQCYCINENKTSHLVIHKSFMCKYNDAKDYDNVKIKIIATSSAWVGKKEFIRVGKLDAGGNFNIKSRTILFRFIVIYSDNL